jgi:hypothetical protein
MIMRTYKQIVIFVGFLLLFYSCSKDFLNVNPTQTLTGEDATATMEQDPSKLTGFVDAIYSTMVKYDITGSESHDDFGIMCVLFAEDMMGQDIVANPLSWFRYDYEHDNRDKSYRRTRINWQLLYSIVSASNSVIGMTSAESEAPDILKYRGQCFALRGMAYYYLIQLYQHVYPVVNGGADLPGIPLYYAANEEKEDITGRAPVSEVLAQIESDLKTAVVCLERASPRTSKNAIDCNVANGFLARYYMLVQKWNEAAAAAGEALKGYSVAETDMSGFMNINQPEWMWGFDHSAETATLYASYFSHISNLAAGYAGINYSVKLIDRQLYDLIPSTDTRKLWFQSDPATIDRSKDCDEGAATWQLPYANLKFGSDHAFTMDYCYMRASEMVLIKAEALAQLGDGTGAASELRQLISKRDPGWSASSVTVDDVILQRRIELWGEGFSTFDLKRLDRGIDRTYEGNNHPVSAQLKIDAQDKRWIFQIPISETNENPDIPDSKNNE